MNIVVLASGGIDSSTMMCMLKKEGHNVFPLFIDYGQRGKLKEWDACKEVCSFLELKPHKMNVSGFGKTIDSGITNPNLDIKKDAFLPTRNLLFLVLGAAYAFKKSASAIAIGLLSNPIFPDQTVEFIKTTQNCISKSLGLEIQIIAPLISLDKLDTLRFAYKYNLPLNITYSCHSGNSEPCGNCLACKEVIAAKECLAKETKDLLK